MFVAIEGMDGVGKTTLAKNISDAFDFKFVEKPMQSFLNIENEQYNELCNCVWSKDNKNLALLFFMLGNLVTPYYADKIIVDRHILSSFYWDGTEDNIEIFKYFYKGNIIPDLTLILYADENTRKKRIYKRNDKDPDLEDDIVMSYGYDKMIDFANQIKLPYVLIDTENMNEKESFKYCSEIIINFIKCEDLESKEKLCNYYNDLFYGKQENEKIMCLKHNLCYNNLKE